MIDFKYGIKSEADAARLQHQIGHYPEPHEFVPHEYIPHMCAVCYETIQSNKPWHSVTAIRAAVPASEPRHPFADMPNMRGTNNPRARSAGPPQPSDVIEN